jgi:hypothetical protein
MAITRAETQVTWPTAANSVSVTAGSNATSEEFNLDATCTRAQISLKADNSTTPAADDIIYFWLLQTSGDPDGASTDEFDTTDSAHALLLAALDTNLDDPAILTVPLPIPQKGGKLYAEGATAGSTNSVTVSATITEQRTA